MRARKTCLAVAASWLLAGHALAQAQEPPPFEKGPVWIFTEIKTKDGHFDDYMKWLDTDFKHESAGMKAAGYLMDYKIFTVEVPRKGEGDIWIAREFPNMAIFDRSEAEFYKLLQSIEGSRVVANQKSEARGSIRDLLGEVMVREVTLK